MNQKASSNQNSKDLETFNVADDVDQVSCDGGSGPLGHPQVWYSFDGKTKVACHYCGRKFVKASHNS